MSNDVLTQAVICKRIFVLWVGYGMDQSGFESLAGYFYSVLLCNYRHIVWLQILSYIEHGFTTLFSFEHALKISLKMAQ